MKIPDRVRVAGHVVETVYKDEIPPLDEGGSSPMGLALFGSNVIVLAERHFNAPVAESNKCESWVHELLHHISEKYSINLGERQVRQLATGLYQVLTENEIEFKDKI
jgi:hypothetical protein